MPLFDRSLAGAGYVVLNGIRVVNIIALLAVVAASSVMLVKTFIVSKFFFFDACEHVIRVILSAFLILTELPLFKGYFSKNWPLFSHRSGFVMLGVAMICLGNGVLGNLNKEATSQQSLGLAFWRIVISAGIVVLVMGFVNILASFVFRDTRTNLTARQVRSHGAVASHKADVETIASTPNPNRRTRYRSFFLGQKRNSLPSYYSHNAKGDNMTQTTTSKSKMNISAPIIQSNNSPRSPSGSSSSKYSASHASPKGHGHGYGGMGTPELSRPNLAHHPAMTGGHAI